MADSYKIIFYDLNQGKGSDRNSDNAKMLGNALVSESLDGKVELNQVNTWLDPPSSRSDRPSATPGFQRLLEDHLDGYSAIIINSSATNYQSALEFAQLACEISRKNPSEFIIVYGHNLPDGNYKKINMSSQDGYLDQASARALASGIKEIIN